MKAWVGWLIAGVVVLGGLVVWLLYMMVGSKESANQTLINTLETWHSRDLAKTQAELDKYKNKLDEQEPERLRLEAEVEKVKTNLEKTYKEVGGLSAEEIASRLNDLGL